MSKNSERKLSEKLKNFWNPLNIYNNLKTLFFSIIPKGSKAYEIIHSSLYVLLNELHSFNFYYQEWIRRYDTFTEEDLQIFKYNIKEMTTPPHISVVMPVYNPPIKLLDQAIQSVIDQIYPYWELCIADDASTNPEVAKLLKRYEKDDSRINLIIRDKNGHISAASNSALTLVSYDHFALLDHDDALHPLALYYVAHVLQEHPDAAIIYSDEDKITKRGRRINPYFKSDFNYELLLSHNMISHLGVYQTSIAREVGGFRVGLEGSQDYDLVLRVVEKCKTDQIHHIPRPLYHWRIIKESAASDINIKPYAIKAGMRAIGDHLARRSVKAKVEYLPDPVAYNVSYALPDELPSVSIISPSESLSTTLFENINSILDKTNYANFQIHLGLPLSKKDDYYENYTDFIEKIHVHFYDDAIENTFAKRVNFLASNMTSDFICILDEKLTGFSPDWLSTLMEQAIQNGVGAVGPRSLDQNEKIYSNGVILSPDIPPQHLAQGKARMASSYFGWPKLTRGFSALSEKCILVKSELYRLIGGLNPDYEYPFFCGIDFCLKCKEKGYRNILRPSVELYIRDNHNYNNDQEILNEWETKNVLALRNRWSKYFQNDPAFNPNLTIMNQGQILVNLSPHMRFLGE